MDKCSIRIVNWLTLMWNIQVYDKVWLVSKQIISSKTSWFLTKQSKKTRLIITNWKRLSRFHNFLHSNSLSSFKIDSKPSKILRWSWEVVIWYKAFNYSKMTAVKANQNKWYKIVKLSAFSKLLKWLMITLKNQKLRQQLRRQQGYEIQCLRTIKSSRR